MVKALDCRIVGSEFALQSCNCAHIRTNTLGKGMNLFIIQAMVLFCTATVLLEGWLWQRWTNTLGKGMNLFIILVMVLFLHRYCSSWRMALAKMDKYPWERYEPFYPSGYGTFCTATVLLEGWLWQRWTNTLGKGMNLFILQAMVLFAPLLFFLKNGFGKDGQIPLGKVWTFLSFRLWYFFGTATVLLEGWLWQRWTNTLGKGMNLFIIQAMVLFWHRYCSSWRMALAKMDKYPWERYEPFYHSGYGTFLAPLLFFLKDGFGKDGQIPLGKVWTFLSFRLWYFLHRYCSSWRMALAKMDKYPWERYEPFYPSGYGTFLAPLLFFLKDGFGKDGQIPLGKVWTFLSFRLWYFFGTATVLLEGWLWQRWTNTLGKGMNLFIIQAMVLFWHRYCSSWRMALAKMDKYPWERYEPSYPSGYGTFYTATVLLEGWLWH